MNKTFSYNISKVADVQAFRTACTKIEESGLGLSKEKLLVDVDGSSIQIYKSGDKQTKVYNDFDVDAVYIDSDIDLDKVFS